MWGFIFLVGLCLGGCAYVQHATQDWLWKQN